MWEPTAEIQAAAAAPSRAIGCGGDRRGVSAAQRRDGRAQAQRDGAGPGWGGCGSGGRGGEKRRQEHGHRAARRAATRGEGGAAGSALIAAGRDRRHASAPERGGSGCEQRTEPPGSPPGSPPARGWARSRLPAGLARSRAAPHREPRGRRRGRAAQNGGGAAAAWAPRGELPPQSPLRGLSAARFGSPRGVAAGSGGQGERGALLGGAGGTRRLWRRRLGGWQAPGLLQAVLLWGPFFL